MPRFMTLSWMRGNQTRGAYSVMDRGLPIPSPSANLVGFWEYKWKRKTTQKVVFFISLAISETL